ncbi:hypothetical protein ABID82_004070 [Methylobacterium sp. PvP062]|uniref:Uncharacterized protein n=1 Tax=Methylobacterium radiotolerans TaxID=31998 RepID=A0ABV2NLV1_9HYPH|nr:MULTISPECIES: hypothetical protein [unclassified Methylobacterium]MBP2495832.1 hypothetical protein [Methylobacterium sp. PvP105]MBP2504297.1 hypothetical protein [Methylobacterium sp. PvP109]MCX7332917.1 hypothetical protein [Hyphomicrobiales bacterium]
MSVRERLRGVLSRLGPRRPARRELLVGLVVAPLAIAGPAPEACADPVFPAAGALGLTPPAGMSVSRRFAGFEHPAGASIILVEMPPEAWDQINGRFTPEALAATGFRVKGGAETLPVAGGEGFVLRGTQPANGLTYAKWVAVVRGAPGTGLVTVQVPEKAARQVPAAAVEAALRTIAFRPKAGLTDQVAALPYTVGDMAGYRPAAVFAGSSLLLTEGPKDVDPEREQPVIVVAPSLGQAPVPSGAEVAVARRLLASQKDFADVKVTDEARSSRGGAVVVRLRGTETDTKSGRALGVTQTMVFDGKRYLRVLGFADAGRTDALDRADRVAASVAMR